MRPSDFPSSRWMHDESRHLVIVAVDPAPRMNQRVCTPNHVHERPKPWWPVFVMAVEAVDDGPPPVSYTHLPSPRDRG